MSRYDPNFMLSELDSLELEDFLFESLVEFAKGLEPVDLDYLSDSAKVVGRRDAFMAAAEFLHCMKRHI